MESAEASTTPLSLRTWTGWGTVLGNLVILVGLGTWTASQVVGLHARVTAVEVRVQQLRDTQDKAEDQTAAGLANVVAAVREVRCDVVDLRSRVDRLIGHLELKEGKAWTDPLSGS